MDDRKVGDGMDDQQERMWTEHGALLERDGEVELPWVRAAASWLVEEICVRPPAHVVDVGSGPGVAACMFAELLPSATVTAVDGTRAFLDAASRRAVRLDVADRVQIHHADLDDALDLRTRADLVWASHVVHHVGDPVGGLRSLAGALAPEGVLAVAEGGLATRILPAGYGVAHPSFLLRVEAALSDHFVDAYELPDAVMNGARDWSLLLGDAGLAHVRTRSFLLDLPAPVSDDVRSYLHEKFVKVEEWIGERLSAADIEALRRLVDADDPLAVVNREDLFVLGAYTVHTARLRSVSR